MTTHNRQKSNAKNNLYSISLLLCIYFTYLYILQMVVCVSLVTMVIVAQSHVQLVGMVTNVDNNVHVITTPPVIL